MKKIILVVIVLTVLGGIALKSDTITVVAPEIIEKTVEVEVETLEKRIVEAQTASSSDIESASQKAYEDKKTLMLKEIELRIRKEYAAELKEEQVQLEKEVGSY